MNNFINYENGEDKASNA